MNKIINIALNPDDISSAIKKLQTLEKNWNKLPDKITKEIAEDGLNMLNSFYAVSNMGTDTDIETTIEKITNGYAIVGSGEEILYEEFGTGEEGVASPHPDKSKYPLNDYNSGPIVSTHKDKAGYHFWYYNGINYGIPSGQQFYNTRKYILNTGIKKAKDKIVGDMLSKL